ncbi:MAG: hypothetical protein JW909_13780 [Planctomycetes bacterium]|nr:hypothetical protein [Planctomycetota bacterium]
MKQRTVRAAAAAAVAAAIIVLVLVSFVWRGVVRDSEESGAGTFLMYVEDVFYIHGKGVVVTGKVERGEVRAGDSLDILAGKDTPAIHLECRGVEAFRTVLDVAVAGDYVGILVSPVEKEDVRPDMQLVAAGAGWSSLPNTNTAVPAQP